MEKAYRCAPIQIANKVVGQMAGNEVFAEVNAINPGFINQKVNMEFFNGNRESWPLIRFPLSRQGK